ncbi:16289_t:CDS:1, partial [Funneliformis caledonium]
IEVSLFDDMIELLSPKLDNLKELYYHGKSCHGLPLKSCYSNIPMHFYSKLDNIRSINLLCSDIVEAILLSKFIPLQNRLQHFILSDYHSAANSNNGEYNIVINSLSAQKDSLQVLELRNVSFKNVDGKAIELLGLLKNIRKLKLFWCRQFNIKLNAWTRNLPKIEEFEFIGFYIEDMSISFIIKLIQSASLTLTRLVIDYDRVDAFDYNVTQIYDQIPLYLHSLTHLTLTQIRQTELVPIFTSCIKLVYLSIIPIGKIEGYLENVIPKRLQIMQFRKVDFINIETLEPSLKKCVNDGGKLKYLEIKGRCNVSQECFDLVGKL